MVKNKTTIDKHILSILIRIAVAIILCIYILRLLDSRNELYILHDEFAYWAIAAKYAGYSWNSMMTDSAYYSMGYSLFLVPLFCMGIKASLMYKFAIVLNTFFVIISYFISCYIAKKLFSDLDDMEITVICGVISLYPYITMQVNYAWPETVLYFAFWLNIFLLCKYAETAKIKWAFLEIIESIWMFFIHQRSIGVLFSCILIVALIFIRNRKYYKEAIPSRKVLNCIVIIILTLVFTILFILLKKYNLEHIFTKNNKIQINDFSGQVYKIKSLLSIKGIINYLWGFAGKYYYFCVSTVLLGPFALFFLIKKIISMFLSFKALEWQWFIYLFLILSFFSTIFVATIFGINDYTREKIITRIDLIFYGRYFEFTLPPLLLIGLYGIRKVRDEFTVYFGVIITFILTTFISLELVKKVQSINKVDLSAPAFNYFFWLTDDYEKAVLHGAVLILFLFLLVGIFSCFEQIKKIRYWIVLVVIGLMWIKETDANDNIIKLREIENESYVYNIVAYIENYKDLGNIAYIYSNEDKNSYQRYAYYIQYHLYQKEMQKIECHNLEAFIPDKDMIYVVMEDSSLKEYFYETCKLLYSNNRVNIFILEEEN